MSTVPLVVATDHPRFSQHATEFADHGCRCPRQAHRMAGDHWPAGTLVGVIHHRIDCDQHPPRTHRTRCPYAGCEPKLVVLPSHHRKPPATPPSREW